MEVDYLILEFRKIFIETKDPMKKVIAQLE